MASPALAAIRLACYCSLFGATALRSGRKQVPTLVCGSDDVAPAPAPQERFQSPPRCSDLEEVKKLAFQRPPSFSEFWASQTCWPLRAAAVERAAHPNGHAGARRRWQRVAKKILEGEEPVSIVVFGGSMTQGMNSSFPWTDRLQSLFNNSGRPRVTVTNLARAGTYSARVLNILAENKKLVSEADVFIMDYAVNDDALIDNRLTSGRDEHMWQQWKEHYSEVLAVLISSPQQPAVLNMETISRPGVDKALCKPSVEMDGMHWDAIQAHGVPTISYSKAVCDCKRSFWMNKDSYHDADTLTAKQSYWHHPGPITHDLVGQLIFASFALEMEGVCQKGITGSDHLEAQAMLSEHTRCLTKPKSLYSATSGSEEQFHPAAILGRTWEFKEDVPGKPGWIAAAGSDSLGELVFNVNVSVGGWLRLEYLASYEGFGDATVWLDADSPSTGNLCTLHGLWNSKSSQSQPSLMKFTFAEDGKHELHIRSQQGAKFKLLGIMSC